MMCSEQSCVEDGQLLSGVSSNHVQHVLPFTKDFCERNNIMTKYSVKKSVL